MKISLKWLKQYVDVNIPIDELAHRLTMVGLEVESIEHQGEKYNKFVVGRVLEVQKHPKADRLSVCKVDVGTEILQIVCGAPNVAPNQIVPVGLSGAFVPRNQHDPEGKPFQLSNVKIRGVESFGMICSAYELALGEDSDGIMVFDSNVAVGIPLAEYFGLDDTVLEIGITPNRADAMSHIGIAREVAAILEQELRLPSVELKESAVPISDCIAVEIKDAENCPRYTVRVIKGIKVGESPAWLKGYLEAIGLRPVNNVVDVTNYVLMEYGHPLHAFDYDLIAGKKIVVQRAKGGTPFTTLDHKQRTLREDTLMICDAEKNVAVAGVMGGENTEIGQSTTNVLLESAYFKPQSVRRTAKYFGLSTDASQRFERGADPNITIQAVNRAAALIHELCGGEILQGVVDAYPEKIEQREIPLRVSRTNEILGSELNKSTIINLLEKIDIKKSSEGEKGAGDNIKFRAPTFRIDLEREIDLIEEVARLYGYDNIDTDVKTRMSLSTQQPKQDFIEETRNWFVGRGFREAISNSMQDKELAGLTSDKAVEVANPISKDMSALRTSLITGLLSTVRNNVFHGTKDIRLFEIGKTYTLDPDSNLNPVKGFKEEDKLILLISGHSIPGNWSLQPYPADLYELKGELETFLVKVFLDNYQFIPYTTEVPLLEQCLALLLEGQQVGMLGKIKSKDLNRFELEQDVYVAEVKVELIERAVAGIKKRYKPLSKYPSVTRDLAVVLDEAIPSNDLMELIRQNAGSLLKNVDVFDIYRGDQIPAGKKSCALSLELLSEEQTLTQEEIDKIINKIVQKLSSTLNATLRA